MELSDALPRWPWVRDQENGPADADAPSVDDQIESTGVAQNGAGWYHRDPSHAVAFALADHQEIAPEELPPLYSSIDTDGLNAVLRSAPDATVTFPHYGYEVTVTGRGDVGVSGIEDE